MRFRAALRLVLLAAALLTAGSGLAQKDPRWTEVRSPHFVVVTSAGDKQGRNIAEQFEAFRAVFSELFPRARVDLGKPLTILAVKNEKELRQLLPAYWETKGRTQPAGVFVPGQEKLYVALRTDTQGEFPFSIVYHEYAHALMRANLRDLPIWLNEGLAEIFAHSLLSSREVTMGRPSTYHLMLLQQSKLLPLEVLLSVTHGSPHYNEQNKTSVFYAQSWAVAHYLFLSEPGREGKLFDKYVAAMAKGDPPVEAAAALGDFKKFEKTIESYIRQSQYFAIRTKPAAKIEKETFAARVLSPAESAALRGDFYVHTNRPAEAKAALEEALNLDASNALAHESMGVLHLREQDLLGAVTWFEKATALDSQSFLAHYFTAMLGVMRGETHQDFDRIESSLRRAMELNQEFVPAYTTLANLYLARDDKLEEALQIAQRAAQLEPGVLQHRITIANVYLRMDKVNEAMQLARSVLAGAKEPTERTSAESFLRAAERYVEEKKAYEAAVREAEERAAKRAEEIAAWEKAAAEREAELRRLNENRLDPSGQQGVARGVIAEVTCTGQRAMNLHLALSESSVQFRAANRTQVAYYLTGAKAGSGSRNFNPCKELGGQRAQVIYKPVKGQAYMGEILAVELLPDRAALPATSGLASAAGAGSPPPSSVPGDITPAGPRVVGTLAEGRAAAVSCTDKDMIITIDFGGINLRMRAEDRSRVEFSLRGGPVPASFNPCSDMRGKSVGVVYKQEDLPGGIAGSILAVDVLN